MGHIFVTRDPRDPSVYLATWNNIPDSIRDSGTLGTFQNCSENTPLQLRLHVMPKMLTTIHRRIRFVTYGADERNICDCLID